MRSIANASYWRKYAKILLQEQKFSGTNLLEATEDQLVGFGIRRVYAQ